MECGVPGDTDENVVFHSSCPGILCISLVICPAYVSYYSVSVVMSCEHASSSLKTAFFFSAFWIGGSVVQFNEKFCLPSL